VVDVQRVDLKPFCVELETKEKLLYFAFRTDEEVYGWMEDIYSRSPLMGVSQPTNFVHQVHVGFDPISGGFTVSQFSICLKTADHQGLPPSWSKLLTSSAITKEEAARNPEAVIDVLQFYTAQQMGSSGTDYQAMPVPTMPSQSRTTSSAATRFEGVGLAGQQQRDRDRAREKTQQAIAPPRAPTRQPSESSRPEVSLLSFMSKVILT
jgi:protein-serine/threonine kinase